MNWYLLSYAVLTIFAMAGALAAFARRPDWLLALAVVAPAFGGFNVYALGTVWFPIKVVTAWCLVFLLGVLISTPSKIQWPGKSLWTVLMIYICLATIVGYIVVPPLAEGTPTGLQSLAMRPAVQAFTYVSLAALVPIAILAVKSHAAAISFWNIYALAAVFSSFVGLTQIIMLSMGVPFMPILRMHGDHSLAATFSHGGEVVYRLYGFAGEPKALAAFMLPITLASALASCEERAVRPWWGAPHFVCLFMAVTILTFSTAAFIGLAIAVVILVVFVHRLQRYRRRFAQMLLIAALSLGAIQLLGQNSGGQFDLMGLIEDRSVVRVQDQWLDRPEAAALNYLVFDRPDLSLFGVGLGMFNFHVPGLFWSRGTEPIDSGWIVSLMDLGLVGTILLAIIIIRSIVSLFLTANFAPRHWGLVVLACAGAMIAAASMHSGWGVFGYLMLYLGIAEAVLRSVPKPVSVARQRRRLIFAARRSRLALPRAFGTSRFFRPRALPPER